MLSLKANKKLILEIELTNISSRMKLTDTRNESIRRLTGVYDQRLIQGRLYYPRDPYRTSSTPLVLYIGSLFPLRSWVLIYAFRYYCDHF